MRVTFSLNDSLLFTRILVLNLNRLSYYSLKIFLKHNKESKKCFRRWKYLEKCHLLDSDIQSLKVSQPLPRLIRCSIVSKSKVILFGGATGDTGKYIITGDTYGLDLIGNKWSKLDGKFKSHFQIILSLGLH